MSRLIQFTVSEEAADAYEQAYSGGDIATLLGDHVVAVAKSQREQRLREAVRIAIMTDALMPSEDRLDTFVADGKATIEANLAAAREAAVSK
jgi:hypothetical protein